MSTQRMSSSSLTKAEVEAAFAACDAKKPHLLKIANLKLLMRSLGFEPRNAEVDALKKKIKEMRKGRVNVEDPESIDVDEFLGLMGGGEGVETSLEEKSRQEMRVAFSLFDKEAKGYITVENLREVARELGEEVREEELKEMLHEAAKDGGGRVSEQQFYEIMKKTCLY